MLYIIIFILVSLLLLFYFFYIFKENDYCFLFFGMRRSGLHCTTFDILQNFKLNNNKIIILNNDTNYLEFKNTKKENNAFIFEDKIFPVTVKIKKQYNIIIIRDIFDNIISRIHKNKEWSVIDNHYFKTFKNILKEALNLTNNIENKIIINYENYFSDSNYREIILKKYFNFEIINSIYNHIPDFGGGQTFNYHDNRTTVIINDKIIHLIKTDDELLELVKRYFKYDLIEKINTHLNNIN